MRRALVLLTIFAIPVLFAGCGLDGGDQTLEEIVEKTFPVDPTARLSLSNVDGSVRIYGADVTEIKMEAIKKAYSAKRLANISIDISAQRDAVSIQTNFPPSKIWGWSDRSGTVDYVLIVPQKCIISKLDLVNGEMLIEEMRSENVNAHLVNGRLFGHNCFGNIHLAVITGGVDVFYDWWEQSKFTINAEIVNGGAHAFIPGDASFHLIAETNEGKIANDFAEKEQRQGEPPRKIDMLIRGASQPEVKLRAREGSIEIREANR